MKAKEKILEPEQGKLLVSEPFLTDPYFKRTVVLLSEHNDHGSVGFILNRITDLKINEAIPDFPETNSPLYFGGPVRTDTLHYIHRIGNKLPGSKEIASGIYWGGDFEVLKLLIDTKQISEDDIRFFVGYSGWEPNQLSNELKGKSWILSNGDEQFAFTHNPKSLWSNVLRSMGNEYAIIANFPDNPSLN